MSQTVSVMLLGGAIRVLQGFAAAAPTLLVGVMIAALMRYYLGHLGIRKLFGGDSVRSLPQAWLLGMLLPVCSIGVLPILREMRRAGVKPGAMSAFALSAPLFNPLSLLYGLTLSRPLVIILFAIGSLLIVTLLGLIWDAFECRRTHASSSDDLLLATTSAPSDYLIGGRRLLSTSVYFTRELTGRTLLLTLIALSGLALLAAVLPFGAMQHAVERDDWWAPLKMLCVAIPVYATPMLAMSQLGMMFQHANSPGAAFTLLILGTGMNFATPVWFAKHFGIKAAALWLMSLLLIVVAISYAINRPLAPVGIEPAGHTHAFDIYANPLSSNAQVSFAVAEQLVTKDLDMSTFVALAVLGVAAAIGIALRISKIDESWLYQTAKPGSFASSLTAVNAQARHRLDIIVPSQVIGGAVLVGLVALSVVACFAYYPPPKTCFDEISVARAECLTAATSGNAEHALYWLPVWEDWSRRLEVGTFIRTGELRPYQRMQGHLIRKKLELLEHELEHDPPEPEEIKAVVQSLLKTNSRWSNTFSR